MLGLALTPPFPITALRSPVCLTRHVTVEKGRYSDASKRQLYPVSTFNSWSARPFSAVLARLRFTPNQVSVLSLLVTLVGLWLVSAIPAWSMVVLGAVLVHLGLVLDHADGQVARRRGMGSTWGMYLDMAFDRITEVGLVVALLFAGPISGTPSFLPGPWEPMGASALAFMAMATIGVMQLWRFLTAYSDVLYLRSHLLASGSVPDLSKRPQRVSRRPLVPWVFNRDWAFLIWFVGVILGQFQIALLLLFVTHGLMCVEKMIVFYIRHQDPEGDASRILDRDYH